MAISTAESGQCDGHEAGIELRPHAFFVQTLLACEGHVTRQEYALFIARARQQSDLQRCVDRIRAWRNLTPARRNEIGDAIRNTRYPTIYHNSTYSIVFHHCNILLHRGFRGLCLNGADLDALMHRLSEQQGVSEIIEFGNEPDCIAFFGDTEHKGTQIEALEYYIDISDVKNAVKVFSKLPREVRGEMTPEEFEKAQFLEKDLEDYLQIHLDKIEPGLKLKGRQYPTKVGPIDLFAKAANGDLVVVELKKGRVADKVFGQICRYMGCVMSEQSSIGPHVRGYIVGREVDVKLQYAAKVIATGVLGLQIFELKGEAGKGGWIQVSAA